MEYIVEISDYIINTLTGIVTIASIVTGFTNTPSNKETIVAQLYKLIEALAFVTNKTKQN